MGCDIAELQLHPREGWKFMPKCMQHILIQFVEGRFLPTYLASMKSMLAEEKLPNHSMDSSIPELSIVKHLP